MQILKRNNRIYRIDESIGHPDLSTTLISELLSCSNVKNFADYELVSAYAGWCSCPDYSRGFEEVSVLSFAPNYVEEPLTIDTLPRIESAIATHTGLSKTTIHNYLGLNMILDVITLNVERRLDSVTLLKRGDKYILSPIHDYCGLPTLYKEIPDYVSVYKIANVVRPRFLCDYFSELCHLFNDVPILGIDHESFMSKLKYIEENKDSLLPRGQEFYDLKKDMLIYQLEKYRNQLWTNL